jgi:hypothetical protein
MPPANQGRALVARMYHGLGQASSAALPPGTVANTTYDPNAAAGTHNAFPWVSQVSGLNDGDCSQSAVIDPVTGQCANLCPDNSRPANGCPPATGIPLWWGLLPTWQKVAVGAGGAAVVLGGGYMLLHKSKPAARHAKRRAKHRRR